MSRTGDDVVRAAAPGSGLDLDFVRLTVLRWLLPLFFTISSALTLAQFAAHGFIGIDARLYRQAAAAAISGGNPWAVHADGTAFAGPPPTLMFYLPTALVPEQLATVLVIIVGVVAGVWAVRRLELPLWWLLFPPLFEALIVGNPDALVLALLLVRNPLAGLAAGLKIYALIPLVYQRRWRAVAVAAIVAACSLPLVALFLSNLGAVSTVLDEQTADLSAWGSWVLIPTIGALFVLRRRGAEWLAVPALWPNTQRHYAALSLPAVKDSPIGAAVMSLGIPLAPAVAVMLMAIESWWHARRREHVPSTPPIAREAPLA